MAQPAYQSAISPTRTGRPDTVVFLVASGVSPAPGAISFSNTTELEATGGGPVVQGNQITISGLGSNGANGIYTQEDGGSFGPQEDTRRWSKDDGEWVLFQSKSNYGWEWWIDNTSERRAYYQTENGSDIALANPDGLTWALRAGAAPGGQVTTTATNEAEASPYVFDQMTVAGLGTAEANGVYIQDTGGVLTDGLDSRVWRKNDMDGNFSIKVEADPLAFGWEITDEATGMVLYEADPGFAGPPRQTPDGLTFAVVTGDAPGGAVTTTVTT